MILVHMMSVNGFSSYFRPTWQSREFDSVLKQVLNFSFFKKYRKSPIEIAYLNRKIAHLTNMEQLRKTSSEALKQTLEESRKAIASMYRNRQPFKPIALPKFNFQSLENTSHSMEDDSSDSSDTESSSEGSSNERSAKSSRTDSDSSSDSESSMDEPEQIMRLPVLTEYCDKLEKMDLSTLPSRQRREAKQMLKIYQKSKTIEPKPLRHLDKLMSELSGGGSRQQMILAFLQSSSMKEVYAKLDKMDLSFLTEGQVTLASLPAELLFYIFSFLGGVNLQFVAKVCKKFSEIAHTFEGFRYAFKLRSLHISKVHDYKHLCLLQSILNKQCRRCDLTILPSKPFVFAK